MVEHFNHLCVRVCVWMRAFVCLFQTMTDETIESVPNSIFLPYLVFNRRPRLWRMKKYQRKTNKINSFRKIYRLPLYKTELVQIDI